MEGNEDIVKAAASRKKIAAAASSPVATSSNIAAVVDASPQLSASGVEEAEDDEFYDAHEFTRFSAEENRSNLIEQEFGFAPAIKPDEPKDLSSTKSILEDSVGERVAATTKMDDDISQKCLIDSLKGYPKGENIRSVLPLDPTKSSKPSLNVWSFLKSAIGKDLSKGMYWRI